MRSTLVVLSLAALGLLVYYGGFVVGPRIQNGVAANAQAAAKRVDAGAQVTLLGLDAQLRGVVASDEARETIKRAVTRVPGIRTVVDKLTVSGGAVVAVVAAPGPVEAAPIVKIGAVMAPSPGDVVVEIADTGIAAPADPDEVDISDEDGGVEEVLGDAAEVPAPAPMVELKWDGVTLRVAGAGSKALVEAMNELMLAEFIADDFVGEISETDAVAPAGFEGGALALTKVLASLKSGSFRIEDKHLKVDVVVADAAAQAQFTRTLRQVPASFKREVNIALAPPPPVEAVAPVELEPVEEAVPAEVAPAPVTDPGGALTNEQCQRLIDAALDGEGKRFVFTRPTSSRLTPESVVKANEIAGYLKRCPEATGTIDGFHHNYGDPDEIRSLTRRRAFSVHAAVVAAGIEAKRFTYQGLGYNYPKYPNKFETRQLNERVEFKLGVD